VELGCWRLVLESWLSTFRLTRAGFGTNLVRVRVNQNTSTRSLPASNPGAAQLRVWHWLASGLALASWLLVLASFIVSLNLPGKAGWPEAALVLTVTLATMLALTRQLPAQNVILAATVIAVIGGGIHALGAATQIPFGPFTYSEAGGPLIFHTVAWPMPLLWVIAILNSRGVARLILRPWRKLRNYGFWLIGITAALTLLFDLALEPFAATVKHYWLWYPTKLPLAWGGAPVTSFLGWTITALLILAFATPVLIDKRQQRSTNRPPDYHPLVTWLLAVTLFAVGAATQNLWTVTGVCAGIGVTVGVFAVRGAKW